MPRRGPKVFGRKLRTLPERRDAMGVIRVPARQSGAVFDDVAGPPENPPLVEPSWHVVVGAENVKVSGRDPLDHEVDGLFRRPGRGRFFGAALCGEAGEDKTGDEE